jgi:hypothetical protein
VDEPHYTNNKENVMEPITNVLSQLGLGLATNAIYDLLKGLAGRSISAQEITQEIQNRINMYGVSIRAETVINALAENGYLMIQRSHLHANQGLIFGSHRGSAVVGNNSALTTNNTAIKAGSGAFMETQGNAQVRQNADGSISFHVGEGGNISIKTSG